MKEIEIKNLKGVEDYSGLKQTIRNDIIKTLTDAFKTYGYESLDTSVLYNYDILSYKYNDDAEILNEIYSLTDQGDRHLALRYDLTIPFCKVIAINKDIHLPYRRYEIGKVFRNGPVKTGRCREFYQCDIDIVGIDGTDIEIEQMLLVVKVFNKLGIDVVIKWNNRKLMTSLIEYIGISNDKVSSVIGIIDKIEKISREELVKEFAKIDIDTSYVTRLLDLFAKEIPYYNGLLIDNELYKEGIKEVNEFNKKLEALNLSSKTRFTPTLARGLSIYTGTVFEFFDKDERLACSLGGGGRYNKIITDFINDGTEYPAVGLSFGLEPIYNIIKDKYSKTNMIDVYIIPMETELKSLMLAEKLRNMNLSVLVELNKRKLKRCFEYANKENIKYVIVIGEDEINNNSYTIKNMETGEQSKLKEEELLEFFK